MDGENICNHAVPSKRSLVLGHKIVFLCGEGVIMCTVCVGVTCRGEVAMLFWMGWHYINISGDLKRCSRV